MRVYDSSAVLAMAFAEPGGDKVGDWVAEGDGLISAVNLSEVLAKLHERGMDAASIDAIRADLPLAVVDFNAAQAAAAANLRNSTRSVGLSLGDRCCLALALEHDAEVITTDRAWTAVPGFRITLPR